MLIFNEEEHNLDVLLDYGFEKTKSGYRKNKFIVTNENEVFVGENSEDILYELAIDGIVLMRVEWKLPNTNSVFATSTRETKDLIEFLYKKHNNLEQMYQDDLCTSEARDILLVYMRCKNDNKML